jgi:hypothetical protein
MIRVKYWETVIIVGSLLPCQIKNEDAMKKEGRLHRRSCLFRSG